MLEAKNIHSPVKAALGQWFSSLFVLKVVGLLMFLISSWGTWEILQVLSMCLLIASTKPKEQLLTRPCSAPAWGRHGGVRTAFITPQTQWLPAHVQWPQQVTWPSPVAKRWRCPYLPKVVLLTRQKTLGYLGTRTQHIHTQYFSQIWTYYFPTKIGLWKLFQLHTCSVASISVFWKVHRLLTC